MCMRVTWIWRSFLMARIRPSELKGVVEVLLHGVPDHEITDEMVDEAREMGTDILFRIDEQRADRKDFFVLINDPGVCLHLHGPYVTKNAASKAIEKGELYAASAGAKALMLTLHQSDDEGVTL